MDLIDKTSRYKQSIQKIDYVMTDYDMSDIGKMAIVCSILKSEFKEWIFCGFYRVSAHNLLEIGPYQSDVIPCGHISFDRGVCGATAKTEQTIIVGNVMNYPNYISCDDKTISEIVIPILKNNQLIAVLDIDGDQYDQFDHVDQKYLEEITNLI